MNYAELLDRAKAHLNLDTDYKLSKALQIDQGLISAYRTGKRAPDNYAIARFAQVLGMDPWTLLKEVERTTEKNPKRREFWDKAASVMLAAIVGVNFFVTAKPANALPSLQVPDSTVYYVKLQILALCREISRRIRNGSKKVSLQGLMVGIPKPGFSRPVLHVRQVAA